jgi:hypothetical protein
MSLFIFSVLVGLALHQLISLIQPVVGSRTVKVGRRIIVQLPERTYLIWKARSIAVAILLFFSLAIILIAQKLHPIDGYAFRFVDALMSPRMAAAVFGGLVGLMLGNLLNRLLRKDADYSFTSSDRLEILLIMFLVLLGIGGEEVLQSYVRRINKISVGTTTEISFSDNRPKNSRAAAEQPSSAFRTTAYSGKSGGSTGLQKLGKLRLDVSRDQQFINVLALYTQKSNAGNSAPDANTLASIQKLTSYVISPIGSCLSGILGLTGDATFVEKELSELSPAIGAFAIPFGPTELPADHVKTIFKQRIDDITSYAKRIETGLSKKKEHAARSKQSAQLSKQEEHFLSDEQDNEGPCKALTKKPDDFSSYFQNINLVETITKDSSSQPYAAMTYASVMAALEHYEAAAITMHNWIENSRGRDDISSWYVLRARFALSIFLEEWIRTRGTAASSWLRQYHVENLRSIVDGMQALPAISALEQGNRDYKFNVGLLGASHSGDDGLCKFPPPTETARRLDSTEEGRLKNLYESYLSARSYFIDHAIKHPIMKKRSAAIINSHAGDLMKLDLKCIDADSRPETRAEHLERYVRNEMNLLENTAPLKSNAEIQARVTQAQQLLGLALQLIEPKVSKARDDKANARSIQERIETESVLEIYETLLATQDQLQEFSERESLQ